jgi:hypothetical protein
MNRSVQRRRWALQAAVAVLTAVGLSACAGGDPIIAGTRPNAPTAPVTPTSSSQTDPAKLSVSLDSLPGWKAPQADGSGEYSRSILEQGGKVTWKVFDGANKVVGNYTGSGPVAFGDSSAYTQIPGVLTFRGNNFRNAPTYGTANITEKKLAVAWARETGDVKAEGSYWAGAGWTGQPLLVNWPHATKQAMGLTQSQVADPNFVEVLYPVVDGKVYRLDLATGTDTKAPIETGFAFKGTGSVDPRGYPLLYSGMGLNENGDIKDGRWRYRIFDLIQNKEVSGWDGADPVEPRDWGAFDSSALVNAATDTLIEPAENGLIYKVKLNATFDAAAKTVSVNPEIHKLNYNTPVSLPRHGIESSAAAWRNLMFAGDNDGNIICWDATTLQVVWVRPTGDDTDATIVLEDTAEGPFLYTGNEMDKRGKAGATSGPVTIQKINALTGQQVWSYSIDAVYNEAVNGGLMATPVLGTGEVSDLVYFNIAKTGSEKRGTLVALDKKTGTVAWQRTLANFGWSSPVLVTGTDGHTYGIVGDSSGLLHMFNPNTGVDYSTLQLSKNIEASPAVYGNMLVVGTYAKLLYGIKIS